MRGQAIPLSIKCLTLAQELLQKQELVLDETEKRIKESYFVRPGVSGFWDLTEVEADSVVIEDEVIIDEIAIGTKKIELDELMSDLRGANVVLDDLESILQEIKINLAKSVPISSNEVTLTGNLFIDGGFDVRDTMSVTNFTFDHLNGLSPKEITEDLYDRNDGRVIEGLKTFESVEAENLHVMFINGMPISDMTFDTVRKDWSNVDFSKLTKLKVEGNLNFSTVNDVSWDGLMKKVVRKSETTTIEGVTIVEGVGSEMRVDSKQWFSCRMENKTDPYSPILSI